MSTKKIPIRVFIDQDTHSRYLIQAGTHGLTSSALGERLIDEGLRRLEAGDTGPLATVDATAASGHGSEL